MKTNRRDFLKLAAMGATGACATGALVAESEAAAPKEVSPNTMAKFYDSTKCIGCQSCVVACYNTNFVNKSKYVSEYLPVEEQNFIQKEDLLPKLAPEDEFTPESPWLNTEITDYRFRTVIQKYVDDKGTPNFIKRNCMHCNKPGCVSACPVSALEKQPDSGVVTYNANRCIGCRYCQMVCPFNVPAFEWHRAVPKIVKCDMCWSTLGQNGAKFNEMKNTACTAVCPTGAVVYGKRSDNLAEAKKRIAENPGKYFNDTVLGETIYGGTGELYLAAVDFKDLGFATDKIADYSYAEDSEGLQHTLYKWGIAPIALYTALAIVGYRNNKKHHDHDEEGK